MERHTYSDQEPTVLDAESIRHAVRMIREFDKQPYITHMSSKYEWWQMLAKSHTARDFASFMGIPCIKEEKVPSGVVRFHMSDGTHTDVPISNRPNYLAS